MSLTRETECPHCQSEDVDPVPFVYRTFKAKKPGKDLFSDHFIQTKTKNLSKEKKERLLKRLTPPEEPKTSLPAGVIAFMAFLVSWLMTGSLIIARLGKQVYFAISITLTIFFALHFFITLNLIVENFHRATMKYHKIMEAWNKQYFCNRCHHIFIPKK